MTSNLNKPLLNGLVLAGGMSKRMRQDKGRMNWHGKEQRYHLADLLFCFCNKVYISCRQDQLLTIDSNYPCIPDLYQNRGPLAGLLSAINKEKNAAWLVIACDLPLLDTDTIAFLVSHRNPYKMATTFESPYDGLPEPLITIWEPSAFQPLMQHFLEGRNCPRKVLLNNDIEILSAPDPVTLKNTNTPLEAELVTGMLALKK